MDSRIEKTIENLRLRQFEAEYARDRAEALRIIKGMLAPGSRIASGGSVTLAETGIIDYVRSSDFEYLDPFAASSPEEREDLILARFSADYFLMSSNAVTTDGRIMNQDGASTRVAPMIYGPKKVIIVAGRNKLVDSEARAKARIKQAAVQNCRRGNFKTPCVEDGRCHDCRVPARSCCTFVSLEFSRIPGRITVIIVDEDLGL